MVGGAAALAALGLAPARRTAAAPPVSRSASPQLAACTAGRVDTWHSLDAMTDPGDGSARRQHPRVARRRTTGRATPRRRTSAATCGRPSSRASSASSPRPTRAPGSCAPSRPSRGWSTTSRAGCTTTGTTRPPASRSSSGRPTGRPVHPFVSSVDSGWLGAALLVVKNSDAVAGPLAAEIFDADALGRLLQPGRRHGRAPDDAAGRAHARRLLRLRPRPAGRRLPRHPHRRRRRLAHHAPLRHDRLRDPDHELPRHPHRPGAGPTLLRSLADLPGHLRLELARDAAGRRDAHLPRASRSTRAPTPTAACTSCPAGAEACSRSSCPRSSCPRRTGRRAAGGSTTRSTCGPSASTGSRRPATATGASRPSSNPAGGYREYGVDALGMNPDGYFSDQENTNYDVGLRRRAARPPTPTPTSRRASSRRTPRSSR